KFVNKCNTGSVFNKSFYLIPLAEIFKIRFDILGVFDKDNDLIAGFAFCHNKKLLFNYIYIPSLVPFYSYIILDRPSKYLSKKERQEKDITDSIINKIGKEYALADFRFHPNFRDTRPLSWNSFNHKINYTYSTDLTNLDNLYENFDSDIKRRIKKTLELDYTFIKDNSKNNIDEFYDLQTKSFVKQQIEFKLNKSQFFQFIENLKLKNCVNIYTIYFEEKPVSSCVVILDGKDSYYLLSGTDNNYSHQGFNQLLIWLTMKNLKENGVEHFDLVGANTETIAHYKSNFNFKLVPLYQAVKYNNRMFKTLFELKKLF
ncbi:GNAT family N-acetyltransferase, partial [Bacteroidota bacterium]